MPPNKSNSLEERCAIEQLAITLYAQVVPLEPKTKTKPSWSELGTNLRNKFRANAQILLSEDLPQINLAGTPAPMPQEPAV